MNRPDLKVPEVVEQWTGADFVADTAVFQHSRRRVRRGGLPAVVPRHLGKRMVPDLVRVHNDFPRTGSGRVITREFG